VESARTQAILLLTAHFSKAADASVKPLSNKEWGSFALWLKERRLDPEKLLSGELEALLEGWADTKISLERLGQLLNRGSALALAMEKWSRSGLWVITRSDTDYPRRLKDKLAYAAPPVLFGCGNRALLNRGGIAVIGSRDTSDEDLAYSRRLGELAAAAGVSVVSGGARGVDEASMLGTLQAEGMAIGVLANDLLRTATSSKYRRHLMNNNLLLLSPYYPEAGFNAGNAMQRNKYIYCLSDGAIAVHSRTKGGTWEGAIENLRNQWVPLWIKPTHDAMAGNSLLVSKGARWLPEKSSELQLNALLERGGGGVTGAAQDMFDKPVNQQAIPIETVREDTLLEPTVTDFEEQPASATEKAPSSAQPDTAKTDEVPPSADSDTTEAVMVAVSNMTLYEHFLIVLKNLEAQGPQSVDQLIARTGLQKTQLNLWLKQAVSEGKLTKQARPIRYQWNAAQQQTMFKD